MFRLPILWLGFVLCGAYAFGLPWQIDLSTKPNQRKTAGPHDENRLSTKPAPITEHVAVSAAIASILRNESTLEETGQIHAARRLLTQGVSNTTDIDLLKRRARLEDYYGASGADAYWALMKALMSHGVPKTEVIELCRRGVVVALRTERYELAKTFADKMADAGDRRGLDLLDLRKSSTDSRTTILGGADALHFLVFGNVAGKADDILTDYSRALNTLLPISIAQGQTPEWKKMAEAIHEYFRQLSSLTALGASKSDHYELLLSLHSKTDKQRTEKILGILGLKLRKSKNRITIESAEGKSQTKKQDTLAALAIDDQGIQDALAAGKPYLLRIPIDSVPTFPAEQLWQRAFDEGQHFPGGFVEAFATDPRLPRMYLALNAMDRTAAEALLSKVPLRTLSDRFCIPLSLFSPALAMSGSHAEVPGGHNADSVWRELTGVSPEDAVPFFQALLSRDNGHLVAFFFAVSQLDNAHQQFFTRSAERARRFYDLFRESSELRTRSGLAFDSGSFVEFLRGVPLNEDGSVDFPGGPEVWMVAKGRNTYGTSMAKMTRKLKRTATPDDEDDILTRLAKTGYKAQDGKDSELANFMAVVRLEAERAEPLDSETALLLAQGYSSHRGLYPYFAEFGDLEAIDYQKAFSLEGKLSGVDIVTANIRLGELHSFFAMLALLRENRCAQPSDIIRLYRAGMDRYIAANDATAWTIASLSSVEDLVHVAGPKIPSRDTAVRTALLGDATRTGERQDRSYQEILALQKVPSLDALLGIWVSLKKAPADPAALDEIQRHLSTFEVLPLPKAWKLAGEYKKSLERYRTTEAQEALRKLREKLNKRKRNQPEIERLSNQLIAELEPWTELAMVGQIYARFLDPTDALASGDPMLLRKHEFISLAPQTAKERWFTPANLATSSEGEGSYFTGGLAEFSLVAGLARAEGNHIGRPETLFLAAATYAGIRATNWGALTSAELQSFGASVRLAREWIVESAAAQAMYQELEEDSRGLLSLVRRKALLEAIDQRDWPSVWEAVSVSDLYSLAQVLIKKAPDSMWSSPALNAMKRAATRATNQDLLGSVAPELSGCPQPRLRRYGPYEDYQFHLRPNRLGQRAAELKMYLAWLADGSDWEAPALARIAAPAADALLSKMPMRDMWDWSTALDGYRRLNAGTLESLLDPP